MTDLHAVTPAGDGGVWLVSTGIDAILRLDVAGAVQERIDLGEPVPGEDFRTVSYDALKPHSRHPNFIAEWGGGLWVTCLETRQCRDLRGGRVLAFPEGGPHDGCLREGLVWFTTVTGYVIAVDPQSTERVEVYDLNELTSSPRMLGWCRGIEVVGDRVWVGMTQLRRSRPREWLRPLLRGEEGRKAPTRLVEFSRSERRLVRETVIGGGTGTTVFGIRAINPGE